MRTFLRVRCHGLIRTELADHHMQYVRRARARGGAPKNETVEGNTSTVSVKRYRGMRSPTRRRASIIIADRSILLRGSLCS